MDFKDLIKQNADRVEKLKGNLQTEEATKNALIMPFIQALGYDIFNPIEVIPEYTCDIGTKKGEKVDYAIMKDDKPIILIECKHWNQDLTLHDNQLLRYFHVSKAKFGILTNGIVYMFYTDLEENNKMDEKPFLEFNMLDFRDDLVEELKKFHKSYFDVDIILSSASDLKYTGEFKNMFAKEFANPSAEFVKYFARQAYDGMITAKMLEMFTELVKRSMHGFVNEQISDRLKYAIELQGKTEMQPVAASSEAAIQQMPKGVMYMSDDGKIVTTNEEIEAFYIVRAILRPYISVDRITYRDAQSYFAVLIDDNNRKPVCRLYFNNPNNKMIAFVGEDKKETREKLSSLDDIFLHSDLLIGIAGKHSEVL
jgi:hypothetical protein